MQSIISKIKPNQEKKPIDKAKDAEYYIQDQAELKPILLKHNARQEKTAETRRFDPSYDMYVRGKNPEDRTSMEQQYLDEQNEKLKKPLYDKEKRERKYREGLQLRQDFMNDSRIAGGIGNLVGDIPGSIWGRYEAKKKVDVQLEERLKELNKREFEKSL